MNTFFLDFLAGFALMNSMPHLLFGLLKIRFLSAFGFGHIANIAYAFLNIFIAVFLVVFTHGLETFLENGIIWGVLAMFVIYLTTARFFINLFRKNKAL